MKKLLYILVAGLLFACKKEENALKQPSAIANIQAEPRVGGAMVKWSLPADSNFLYLELRYMKKGEVVKTKISKYTDSVLVTGLLNKYEYTFELQPFNANEKGAVGGVTLTSGKVTPIRRPIETSYFSEKLKVTDNMIETYTQETSEGPKKNLVDGDRNTYWHSAWSAGVAPLPHWVKIQFAEPTTMGVVKYFFRNNTTQNGRPTQIGLETSEEGVTWNNVWTSPAGLNVTTPAAEEKTLAFDKNYTAKYFRIMFLATQGNTTFVTLGDMSFFKTWEELTDLEKVAEENY